MKKILLLLLYIYVVKYNMDVSNKKVAIEDIVSESKCILKKSREYIKNMYLDQYMKNNNIKNIKNMNSLHYKRMYDTLVTDEDYENLHKKLIQEHRSLASVYPIIIRSIVYNNELYDEAVRLYVSHLSNHPWKNKQEFVERQGEFLIYTFRCKYPKIGSSEVARYKQEVIKKLVEENKQFEEWAQEVKETCDKEREDILKDRKDRVRDLLIQLKETKSEKS